MDKVAGTKTIVKIPKQTFEANDILNPFAARGLLFFLITYLPEGFLRNTILLINIIIIIYY
jgi:hypothetical protein